MRPIIRSLLCAGLGLASCAAPPVGSPCPIPETHDNAKRAEALKQCVYQGVDTYFQTSRQKNLDLLFLIDNSPSMTQHPHDDQRTGGSSGRSSGRPPTIKEVGEGQRRPLINGAAAAARRGHARRCGDRSHRRGPAGPPRHRP